MINVVYSECHLSLHTESIVICFPFSVVAVISSSAPYLGEGILHQKPPSPYRGDVILYPEPNTPPLPLPFLFTSYSINTNPGWDTTLYVENVDIAFSDVIEVRFGCLVKFRTNELP